MKPYNANESKSQQIESMFDGIAPRYDLLNRVLSLGIDNCWRRKAIRMVGGADKILDVATGTGDLAIMLAAKYPNAHITGADLSEGMLRVARAKIAKKGLTPRINLVQAAAEHLPFVDGAFDAATAAFGVRNFEDIRQGMSEMRRVVRRGGKVMVLEFSTPRNKFFGSLYHLYFHKIVPLLGGLVSRDRRAYDYLPRSVEEMSRDVDLQKIMHDAGFDNVEVVSMTFGVAKIYIGE